MELSAHSCYTVTVLMGYCHVMMWVKLCMCRCWMWRATRNKGEPRCTGGAGSYDDGLQSRCH